MIEIDDTALVIGWDVGGWNCDHNPKSRDALVVLDSRRRLLGRPWRGNLRQTINESDCTKDFVSNLLALCSIQPANHWPLDVILAIDTPLGFSKPFIDLITMRKVASEIGDSTVNPYLHRKTEHFLFTMGLSPLSPVKDMIGSQATKGMHVLGKFAPEIMDCGMWTDRGCLRVIEAYPSACKHSSSIELFRSAFYAGENPVENGSCSFIDGLGHVDLQDALTCALIGWAYRYLPELLVYPCADIDPVEGWIFVPKDGLKGHGSL